MFCFGLMSHLISLRAAPPVGVGVCVQFVHRQPWWNPDNQLQALEYLDSRQKLLNKSHGLSGVTLWSS